MGTPDFNWICHLGPGSLDLTLSLWFLCFAVFIVGSFAIFKSDFLTGETSIPSLVMFSQFLKTVFLMAKGCLKLSRETR